MGRYKSELEVFDAGIEDEGDGAIVLGVDLHVCGKGAGGDCAAGVGGAEVIDKSEILGHGDGGTGGAVVGGSGALAQFTEQGELADDEQVAGDVGDGQVHAPVGVFKAADAGQLLRQPLPLVGVVISLYAEKNQQAALDGADGGAVDGDAGLIDTLNYRTHEESCWK